MDVVIEGMLFEVQLLLISALTQSVSVDIGHPALLFIIKH